MALTAATFVSNLTAPVNFVLMKGLLKAARKTCPYFNGTLPGQLQKAGGSASVKWRRIENLSPATTALGEVTGTVAFGMGRDAVQPTITDISVAMAKYGNPIYTTEEVDLYNVNSNSTALMETLGANAGESLNILMRDVMNTGASVVVRRASSAAADTTIVNSITVADIKYCVNQLNRNSAMKFFSEGNGSRNIGTSTVRSSYYGVCHSDVEEDIRSLTGFIPVEQYGGYTETDPGEFGALGGVRWSTTEIAPVSSSSATTTASGYRGASATANDIYRTFIYGKEAVGSVGLGENMPTKVYKMYDRVPAVQLMYSKPQVSVADPFGEMSVLSWKAFFAGKVLNTNWIARLSTLSKAL